MNLPNLENKENRYFTDTINNELLNIMNIVIGAFAFFILSVRPLWTTKFVSFFFIFVQKKIDFSLSQKIFFLFKNPLEKLSVKKKAIFLPKSLENLFVRNFYLTEIPHFNVIICCIIIINYYIIIIKHLKVFLSPSVGWLII